MSAPRRLVAAAMAAILALLTVGTAAGAEAERHAWWWRVQTGLAGSELPPPPDVPDDGLLVEQLSDGPTAVSAVRVQLQDDEIDPVLTLVAVTDPEDPASSIVACPATTGWSATHGGRWDAQPLHDCELGRIEGVRGDGGTWSWELGPLVGDDGVVDVVLVSGSATPFRATFEAPGDDAVTVTTRPAPPVVAPPVPTDDAPPANEPPPPPPPVTTAPGPFVLAEPAPEAPPTTGAVEPQVAPPATTQDAPARAAPNITVIEPETGPNRATLALSLAILLVLVLNVVRGRAAAADPAVRGVGRFRRARTAPVAKLR